MNVVRSIAAGAALAVGLCALGAPAPAAESTYKINILTPATGSGAFLGKSYAETYRALEIAINKTGGIKGHPVAFVLNDTATSPQQGLQIVNGLIAAKQPVYIDGGPSTVCGSSIPIVVNTGPVDFCLSPLVHPPTGSYVFSAGLAGTDQARMAVRYFRQRGWTRIAMISSTDTTGQDLEKQTDAALELPENKGVQLVAREHFNPSDISVPAQIARLKGANPQAIITWTTGSPFGTVVHGLKDAGIEMPVLTTNSNMTYAQMSAYTNFLPKEMYFPALLAMTPEATGKGPLHDMQVAYTKAFAAIGVKPDEGHILAWDPTMIVVTALRALGPNATAQQIRDYILHMHGWVGVDGVYDFSSGNQRGISDNAAAIARWDPAHTKWVRVSKPTGKI
jgi:branched-chain amino acid transport system substrate-binding protein